MKLKHASNSPVYVRELCMHCGPIVTTDKGAFSRSTLLQHAPGAKLPRLRQRFLAKKYVAQQNFCSRVWLPRIKLVWYEGANSRDKSVARVCFRSKLPWCVLKFACRDMTCLQLANQIGLFFSSTTHCELTFKVLMPQIGLFHHSAPSSCPSCVLVGVLTRERVSGASFLVCSVFYNRWHGYVHTRPISNGSDLKIAPDSRFVHTGPANRTVNPFPIRSDFWTSEKAGPVLEPFPNGSVTG